MRRKIHLSVLALLILASSVFGQAEDFLKPGSWEFGASLMFVHRPTYPLLMSGVSEEDRGEYLQTLEIAANIGKFLAEGFSLSIRPSLFYLKNRDLNSSLQENTSKLLFLGVGAEASFYLSFNSPFLLSLGGELGLGIIPGLMELDDDVKDPNHSFTMAFWLEPKVRGYYLLSSGLAPFAELGWQLMYQRRIKERDGSSYSYPAGYSPFEDVISRFNFTLGLKYFLPATTRFELKPEDSFNDALDKGLFG